MKMHIKILAKLLRSSINVTCVRDGSWHADMDHIEIKVAGACTSNYGSGKTPRDAIIDYCNNISNKHLIIRAMIKDERMEIDTPVIFYDEVNDA